MRKIAFNLLQLQLLLTITGIASCPIFLTISLSGKSLADTCLEINWGPNCFEPPEWVGLYRQDPSVSNFLPEMRIYGVRNRTGKRVTPFKLGKLRFPGGWDRDDNSAQTKATKYPKGKCLPYYVASYNGNELLTIDCLKIQPNWLANIKEAANLPLKRLFIPGTHASGAFLTKTSNIKNLLVKDYLVAQHFDVWSQLVFGIRYLEFTVGYRKLYKNEILNEADDFWVLNENMFITPLVGVLRDVRRFVQLSDEVVVLDFSSFPVGFYKQPLIYSSLYRVINKELGEVAFERNVSSNEACADRSYNELRVIGRQVLILFPTEELPHPENESVILCTPWQRFSSSYMNISMTLDYMRLLFSKKPDSPVQDNGWIFMGVNSIEQGLNSHLLLTTMQRAAVINPKINLWLSGPWGLNANVVAMDYFSNTNLIDVAIHTNLHKAFLAAHEKYVNLEIES